MTQKRAESLSGMTIKEALVEAFRAGEANRLGSHYYFFQTHLPEKEVVAALLNAIKKGESK
jgi:hypothetical protein